ncbi:MAG TPA: spore coat protein U domain-containing protein, partial [Candidatus Acidoferrales bacterium]|nr:spore coat protein U domain-containing protein [Candidatus Acidoferrales bacterium]
MKRSRYLAHLAALLAMTALLGRPAAAGTATGNLLPTMTIANACLDTNATVSFPIYLPNSPSPVTAPGSGATLTCNVGDAWSIKAAKGNNSIHATGTCAAAACTRAMTDGAGHYIGYDLYVGTCCTGTTVWSTTSAIAGTG